MHKDLKEVEVLSNMNKPKCNEYLYTQFLIAAQTNFTSTEFSVVSPNGMAHDAPTRWLGREKLTPSILWKNVEAHVNLNQGYLIGDDSVLDKPRAEEIALVHWQYSGNHHKVVKGIGLVSLLWTGESDQHIPVDYRIYDKDTDDKTKNQHFREMLITARSRGFNPWYILLDMWYANNANLKLIDRFHWKWVAQLKKNRIVNLNPHQPQHLDEIDIPAEGVKVYLRGYGFVLVLKTVTKDNDVEYYATNDLTLTWSAVERIYKRRWKIEEYHRGLKQNSGIAKCQSRSARAQRNHIWCALHALLILELHRIRTNISWQNAKLSIVRQAIHQYLLAPKFNLQSATA